MMFLVYNNGELQGQQQSKVQDFQLKIAAQLK